MSDKKYLVTGANGKLGRQVVSFLLDVYNIQPSQLIATSRDLETLDFLSEKGIETRRADYADPESLDEAFKGVDRLLLISMDAVGQRDKLHKNAVVAAEKAGVEFIAYTSMPNADSSPLVFAFEHKATEKAILDSGISNWTILRNNWYFENLAEFYGNVLQTQTWLTASGEGRHAQLSRKDLALAAAAALVKSEEGKNTITLNGAEALTTDDMAETINQVLGLNVNVIHVSDEGLKGQLESFKLPPEAVAFATTMDLHLRNSLSDGSSAAFEGLTGQKPQPYSEWLKENSEMLTAIANS